MSPKSGQEGGGTSSPKAADMTGSMRGTKSVEAEERARRQAEREKKRQQEEAKQAKVAKLGATNPNASEILRIRDWTLADKKKKEAFEEARLQRELAEEKATKEAAERVAKREEKFET